MSVDKATVRNIAYLARIRVSEEELDPIANDLNRIVGWVEQLGEVDTDGVEPLDTVTEAHRLPWRKDEVTDGRMPEKILANAPEAEEGCFLVPKVVE